MLFPGSGDLTMQIAEKGQFSQFRPRIRAAKEPLVEFGRLRLAGLDSFSVARKHIYVLGVGRGRPLLESVGYSRPEILRVGSCCK